MTVVNEQTKPSQSDVMTKLDELQASLAAQLNRENVTFDRVNAVSELVMAMTREVAELRRVLDVQSVTTNTLLTSTASAKAAAADASAHSSNVAVDIASLMTAVNDMSARVEALERTVRGLKIYKSVQTDWDS